MNKKLKLHLAALSVSATLLLATNVLAVAPDTTFYAAGSSAQFNTFSLGMGATIFSGGPLCGAHRWTKKSSGSTTGGQRHCRQRVGYN
jgi:hypothetical protein